MARPSLVLDASVGVKWFSDKNELYIEQAVSIRNYHVGEIHLIIVPDIFYYEVSNALTQKKHIPGGVVQSSIEAMFTLGLQTIPAGGELLANSVSLARRAGITIYAACYIAAAIQNRCPLVTADPRHQKEGLGCRVIPLENWDKRDLTPF